MAAPLLLVAVLFSALADDTVQTEKSSCTWECITYALVWPGTFCVSMTPRDVHCKIPQYIQNWTIHGLWPMRTAQCCNCWPIFPSDLEELEPEISHLWPNLKSRSGFCFWKEEWIKHGSCAACIEGMNSPTRYFQRTLKLRGHFDIDRALMDAGIKPSCNKTYQFEDLHSALAPIIGDYNEIQCWKDKGREVLVQVKISLFRNFTLGCPTTPLEEPTDTETTWQASLGHPCPRDAPVFYYPISYEHPKDPCG